MPPLDGQVWGTASAQEALFLALALLGLCLSLAECRAAHADATWRERRGLNGVGTLVARDAVWQEALRSLRMAIYVTVALAAALLPNAPRSDVRQAADAIGLALCLAVLLDGWTSLRKGRLRRQVRRLELAHLGDVVRLDTADSGR